MFRFSAEEDVIKAKVEQYHRGGVEIAQTLTVTWNQRLEYEQKILIDRHKTEKEYLAAAQVVAEQDTQRARKELLPEGRLLEKVQRKGSQLTARLEALLGQDADSLRKQLSA